MRNKLTIPLLGVCLLFILVLSGNIFLIKMYETKLKKANAMTYYADAVGQSKWDSCKKININVVEDPFCARITHNDPNACTVINGTPNNVSNYAFTISLSSRDGQNHTIDYGAHSNFCDSGHATFDTGSGYCACIQNTTGSLSTKLTINANGTQTLILNRANPYGQSCGTYQQDFWINSVDGDTNCNYGDRIVVGASGLCETGTTCTNPTYTISGNVFIDTNLNGIKDNGESNYTGAVISLTGKSTGSDTSDTNGFSFSGLQAGNYTTTLTVPAGYVTTNATTQTATVGPNKNFDFGIRPLSTVSGYVFLDSNKNGVKDNGEVNYPGQITIASSRGSVTSANGNFTISNLSDGSVTISYQSIPAGYILTSPSNGPPPSYSVTVGANCNNTNAPGSSCINSNIINLGFGITDLEPWMQISCGSIRLDNGLYNPIPNTSNSGLSTIITNPACTTPGILVAGDTNPQFKQGNVSVKSWLVGGTTYPEVYNNTGSHLNTSCSVLQAKAKSNKLPINDLSTVCNTTNCTLPANLPHGIWQANGDLNLNSFNVPANNNYVFFVNGKTQLNGNILVPQGNNNSFMLCSKDTITVGSNVGVAPNISSSSLDGIFTTDKSFIVNSTNTCNDLRLNMTGAIVTNAGRAGGTLMNNRDLCQNNSSYPTFTVTQRADLLFNLPDLLRQEQSTTTEVAP